MQSATHYRIPESSGLPDGFISAARYHRHRQFRSHQAPLLHDAHSNQSNSHRSHRPAPRSNEAAWARENPIIEIRVSKFRGRWRSGWRLDQSFRSCKTRVHEQNTFNGFDVMRVLLTDVRRPGKIFGQGNKTGSFDTAVSQVDWFLRRRLRRL